mmetsp:Transcript_19976/g.37299  ORF Transcript_19976/g.37299 Transcript_19976/m.37299 type:complete len:311 (-) Transcript_19976:580-1512(-)
MNRMDLPSPSSPHVRQEQIDQLRSRVDNVLRNLVKSTELDTQSLKTQVESLRESPASLLLDSTATDKSLALNENTTTSKQKQSPVTTKLGVVDNDPKSISNVSKRSTTTTTSQWIVDPYGDQGEFEGDLNEENLPHGFGVMKYTDGRIYSGHWKNGRWHGNGRATFSNGDVFEGTYYEDQRHGQGVYRWVDGREFRGGFLNDQRSGHGVYTWPDGAVYDGEFVNGLREGHGKYTFHDGSVYEGGWKQGKYSGQGEVCNRKALVSARFTKVVCCFASICTHVLLCDGTVSLGGRKKIHRRMGEWKSTREWY